MLSSVRATSDSQPDSRWQRLFARQLEVRMTNAFRYFRSRDIEPILIKGWAAARNYPEENSRYYDDIDLAVSKNDFEKARFALVSGEGPKLSVDLHLELRHLDTKPWESIVADSQLVELDGYRVRIPCAEDHLRILAVHWLNDGGQRKDRLWDIYYAIANRPDDFDWDKCFNEVSERRRAWILAAIGLTYHYLELPIDDLPFAEEAKDLPPWLIKTVESEWESATPLVPLVVCLRDPAQFLRQVRKRLPPNPLEATIEMEGDIRNGVRLKYQLGSMRKRFLPSVRGLAAVLRARSR
jgi:hypothetical protein